MASRGLRRLAWRFGRHVYSGARGEQRSGRIRENGEADVQRCVLNAVPRDVVMRVCDIGANRGEWTLSLLKQATPERRTAGRLCLDAFEPVPTTAGRFAAAIAPVAGNECVRLHNVAISDAPGEARISVMSDSGGTNTLHHDGITTALAKCDVKLDTLSDFCARENVGHLHLVKCDTEGHDAKVIAGARPLLRDERIDVMQFEYNHRWVLGRAYLRDVFEIISGLPYKLGKVRRGGRIDLYDAWHPELEHFIESNYVLLRNPAVKWFDAHHGSFDRSNTYA